MAVDWVADRTSGTPVDAVVRPMKLAVAMLAIFARVTAPFAIVAAKDPVPLPVTSPVSVIVWSPVFDPLTEVVPVTARVGVDDPEIATVLYLPPVMSPVVSAIVTAELWISFPVVRSNLATALSTADAGPTTSPVPVGVAQVPSPRQKVDEDALVPLLRLATGRFPVTPVERGRPVQFVRVPLEGVPNTGVVSVGLVSVLFVSVSVPASVASVPVVGSVTVPDPAIAVASKIVEPDVEPAIANFPTAPAEPNVFFPVTVWTDARTMSPELPEPVQ
jgi:hypothetical protein